MTYWLIVTHLPRIGVVPLHVVLAALIFSLHHWVAVAKNHGNYTPFSVSRFVSSWTFDETRLYAPPAQRFMSLGRLCAEVDNYERRNSSAGIPFIPEAILGTMGLLLGNLERAFIAADVIFPPMLLLLFYALTHGIIQTRAIRLLIAWSAMLIPFGPRNALWLGYDAARAPPDITRTPQPEISFVFVLLGILLLGRALCGVSDWRLLLSAGMVSAVIVYCYYFYAIAWGMTLVLLFVAAIVWKKWLVARRTAEVLGVMIAGAIPFVLAVARGRREGGQTFLLERMGNYTHRVDVLPLVLAAAGFALLFLFGKRLLTGETAHARYAILAFVVLAGFCGMNFQVISGYDARHDHFWNRLVQPVGYLAVACAAGSFLEHRLVRYKRRIKWGVIFALICLLGNATARQLYSAIRVAELHNTNRPEIRLLTWVRSNVSPEHVIGTVDPELILMLPALTAEFTYVPSGPRSLTPTDEITQRYFELAFLIGLADTDVLNIASIPNHVYPSLLLFTLGYFGTLESLAEEYRGFPRDKIAPGRRLDYVVVPADHPIPRPLRDRFPDAKVIYDNERYRLIDLHNTSSPRM